MTVSRTICLGFLATIAIGTILLMLPIATNEGNWNNPIVALFTATSAVCVTGLVVVDTGSYYSGLGQFFILLMIQIGGLGYMTATSFLLILLGRKFRLRDKVALQQSFDKPGMAGVAQLIRSIIAATLLIEISGAVLMMPIFATQYGNISGLWLSIFHSISAFNNAGFSIFADSLVQYARSPLINIVITLLVIFGGIGYDAIMEMYFWVRDRLKGRTERGVFSLHFKMATSTTIFLLILGTIVFFSTELHNPNTLGTWSFGEKLLGAWFQSVTTRTAGFNTIDLGQMTAAGLFVTIVFMFIGASSGSTGGGIKTTTVRVLFNATKAVLQGREQVLCYHRQIPMELVLKAIGVVVTYLAVAIASTIALCITDPNLPLIQILFEVVSAIATVGLSMGITASFSPFGQLVLIITMYVGRVGALLLVNAILGDPKPTIIRYPEEELLVG